MLSAAKLRRRGAAAIGASVCGCSWRWQRHVVALKRRNILAGWLLAIWLYLINGYYQ